MCAPQAAIDRLIEIEPAINDTAKKQAKYDSFYTYNERELKRKARETRIRSMKSNFRRC